MGSLPSPLNQPENDNLVASTSNNKNNNNINNNENKDPNSSEFDSKIDHLSSKIVDEIELRDDSDVMSRTDSPIYSENRRNQSTSTINGSTAYVSAYDESYVANRRRLANRNTNKNFINFSDDSSDDQDLDAI